ncbi:hypothetical protein [Streptomyces sp. WM6378]|nr:hypothetical protein [Streptomyces sp. WM6378]
MAEPHFTPGALLLGSGSVARRHLHALAATSAPHPAYRTAAAPRR